MSRRIEPRRQRVGSGHQNEPEAIAALEERREKHERVTRGKPARAFGEVLNQRLRGAEAEVEAPVEEEARPARGARDPLLGLDPNQDASLANRPAGKRSGRVIVKG